MSEKEYLYWMTGVEGIGAVTIKKMKEYAKTLEQAFFIEKKEWEEAGILAGKILERFQKEKKDLKQRAEEYHRLKEKGIDFISLWDKEYPEKLKEIYDSPAGLFVKGKLPENDRPALAVVGARHCTSYGRMAAKEFSAALAAEGIQIISGLAYGIDGEGHRGAQKAGGKTFAVLGCGVDICYPREHYCLYQEIAEKGGLISEYLPSSPPLARNFPMRNRIISGLADAVLVVEAAARSGSLITAELALDQGRDVFAVPGRISDPLSAGTNELIKSGAGCVTAPEDVLDHFHIISEKMLRLDEKNGKGLAKTEKMVYSCLDLQPKSLEEVVAASRLSVGECMTALYGLEKKGYVTRAFGQYYEKKLQVRG